MFPYAHRMLTSNNDIYCVYLQTMSKADSSKSLTNCVPETCIIS